jgi:hypothetical protein
MEIVAASMEDSQAESKITFNFVQSFKLAMSSGVRISERSNHDSVSEFSFQIRIFV